MSRYFFVAKINDVSLTLRHDRSGVEKSQNWVNGVGWITKVCKLVAFQKPCGIVRVIVSLRSQWPNDKNVISHRLSGPGASSGHVYSARLVGPSSRFGKEKLLTRSSTINWWRARKSSGRRKEPSRRVVDRVVSRVTEWINDTDVWLR